MEELDNEVYYVYKSLHSDESWGAILNSRAATNLPNIRFGMRIIAPNEKAAIARGRKVYDELAKTENKKRNIKDFAVATITGLGNLEDCIKETQIGKGFAKRIVDFAKTMANELDKDEDY